MQFTTSVLAILASSGIVAAAPGGWGQKDNQGWGGNSGDKDGWGNNGGGWGGNNGWNGPPASTTSNSVCSYGFSSTCSAVYTTAVSTVTKPVTTTSVSTSWMPVVHTITSTYTSTILYHVVDFDEAVNVDKTVHINHPSLCYLSVLRDEANYFLQHNINEAYYKQHIDEANDLFLEQHIYKTFYHIQLYMDEAYHIQQL
ncbi:hypothetical protein LTR86_007644 [Recurvomyces mirabilis]|nr:hypothetical protein LTR86_007644 [Recurvomyces mirabilis]